VIWIESRTGFAVDTKAATKEATVKTSDNVQVFLLQPLADTIYFFVFLCNRKREISISGSITEAIYVYRHVPYYILT